MQVRTAYIAKTLHILGLRVQWRHTLSRLYIFQSLSNYLPWQNVNWRCLIANNRKIRRSVMSCIMFCDVDLVDCFYLPRFEASKSSQQDQHHKTLSPILYTQPCVKCNRFIIYTTDQTTLCICNEYLIYTTSADGDTWRTKSVSANK